MIFSVLAWNPVSEPEASTAGWMCLGIKVVQKGRHKLVWNETNGSLCSHNSSKTDVAGNNMWIRDGLRRIGQGMATFFVCMSHCAFIWVARANFIQKGGLEAKKLALAGRMWLAICMLPPPGKEPLLSSLCTSNAFDWFISRSPFCEPREHQTKQREFDWIWRNWENAIFSCNFYSKLIHVFEVVLIKTCSQLKASRRTL